jgi:hypothetical protein
VRRAGTGWDAGRLTHNPEVAGSNPAPATNFRSSGPFPAKERAFGVIGHVTKYVTKREPVRRAEGPAGETGWHSVRQRGTQ